MKRIILVTSLLFLLVSQSLFAWNAQGRYKTYRQAANAYDGCVAGTWLTSILLLWPIAGIITTGPALQVSICNKIKVERDRFYKKEGLGKKSSKKNDTNDSDSLLQEVFFLKD